MNGEMRTDPGYEPGRIGTVCGIDEAGRGPIAGPVSAAAVVLSTEYDRSPLRDSKTLSHRVRMRIALSLLESGCLVGVGWAWPEEIDRINIHHASLLAMRRAYEEMRENMAGGGEAAEPESVKIDGKFVPELPLAEGARAEAVVKGDRKIPEISAASIVAKVVRDLWMMRYARIETKWDFEQHKGYPTARHLSLCAEHGLSPIHRRSFTIKTLR